jgi:hypothetical protein
MLLPLLPLLLPGRCCLKQLVHLSELLPQLLRLLPLVEPMLLLLLPPVIEAHDVHCNLSRSSEFAASRSTGTRGTQACNNCRRTRIPALNAVQ